jgi:uncharacterized protein (DUF433 family)
MVAIHPIETPIRVDKDGVLRVGQTRVVIDLVVYAHEQGFTPEEIVEQFDVLNLSDIYGVIAYYLGHKEEIQDYIQERKTQAEALRKKILHDFPDDGVMERLLLRKAQQS